MSDKQESNKQTNNKAGTNVKQPVAATTPKVQTTEKASAKAEKTTSQSNRKSVEPEQAKKSGGKWGLIISIFALLLALGALAAAGWLYMQQEQRQQASQSAIDASLEATSSTLKSQINNQQNANRTMQRQVDQLSANNKQQQRKLKSDLADINNKLRQQQKRISMLSTTDRTDWLLAEVEYLIRLANQRLLMGGEIKGAASLLKAADDILIELDDTALYPVRKALADNLAALKTAAKHDKEGIYLQLGGLAKEADSLRLFAMPNLNTKPVEELPTEPDWQQKLNQGLAAAVDRLNSYVQIRRNDEHYNPVLAPEYETAVRQNVRLMFEQAQMALLSGNQRLYTDSINKAIEWLGSYYTLDADRAKLITDELKQLKQQQITVNLPDISSSLRALKNYIETIHNAPTSLKKRKTVKTPVGVSSTAQSSQNKSASSNTQALQNQPAAVKASNIAPANQATIKPSSSANNSSSSANSAEKTSTIAPSALKPEATNPIEDKQAEAIKMPGDSVEGKEQ